MRETVIGLNIVRIAIETGLRLETAKTPRPAGRGPAPVSRGPSLETGWEAESAGAFGRTPMEYVWIRVVQDDWEYTERVDRVDA